MIPIHIFGRVPPTGCGPAEIELVRDRCQLVDEVRGNLESRIEQGVLGSLDPAKQREIRVAKHLRGVSPFEAEEGSRRVRQVVGFVSGVVIDLGIGVPSLDGIVRVIPAAKC